MHQEKDIRTIPRTTSENPLNLRPQDNNNITQSSVLYIHIYIQVLDAVLPTVSAKQYNYL